MAVSVPNGSLVAIASAYGAIFDVTNISNANPAIASFESGHGVVAGDYFEIVSGWSRITDRIFRAGSPTGDNVPIAGLDSTSTSVYPAASGGGTARKISTFTQVSQILDSSSTGGEQQFLEYQFLESDAQKRIPTFKSASGLTFQIADDPSLPGYQELAKANDDRLPRAVRITLPSGSVLLYNAYVSLNKTPSLTVNQLMAVEATLSLLGESVRYAS